MGWVGITHESLVHAQHEEGFQSNLSFFFKKNLKITIVKD